MSATAPQHELTRRRFFAYFSALGISSTVLPEVIWAKIQQQDEEPKITKEMLDEAEQVAGLQFTDSERELMLQGLNNNLRNYERLREVEVANSVPPALYFNPVPAGATVEGEPGVTTKSRVNVSAPSDLEEVAFWPVTHLAELISSRRVSSLELTRMYLERLKRYGPKLECVITLTEEMALAQALRADEEIAAGNYRGPLHGIPWGAKDLLAVRGYKTTWGAAPFSDQMIDEDATVVTRLADAGAVLVAKLTLGALAWGDVWYGGTTKNPWNYEQGSSGSSAGSASATAAGLVGFAIGTETWGSIVSPCTRCGTTGLRPTFGRVSRHGAMALSWSMDKIGPICRSVEDSALVFDAIYGPDGKDLSVVNMPYHWDPNLDIRGLRIGYVQSAFDEDREEQEEWKAFDERSLETLQGMGLEMVPIELPDMPVGALSFILSAEAATAFDQLTRSNRDDQLVRQIRNAWPNAFRQSRFIPAVEYIQANRVRTLVMQRMVELMSNIDVYVIPSFGGSNLLLTNLTGHPCVVVPNGFRQDGTPTSISFMGKLFGEGAALAVARAYQNATDFHQQHPTLQA